MNFTLAACAAITVGVALVTISMVSPWVLSDSNGFLRGFVNHELMAFLGVIVTITLASLANLHLALNGIEERLNRRGIAHRGFGRTRSFVKRSAAEMIGLVIVALVLVVAKPLVVAACSDSEIAAALFNSGALWIVLCNLLILLDITRIVIAIPARRETDGENNGHDRDARGPGGVQSLQEGHEADHEGAEIGRD